MAFDPISAALDIGGKLIDRLWPDPTERDKAKLKLLEMRQTGELAALAAESEMAKGQMEVNKTEAAHMNIFVAGWRPMVGWVCAMGLGTQFIIRPAVLFIADLFGHKADFPTLDMGTLLTLLFGMLGLGAMRSVEKINSVATK